MVMKIYQAQVSKTHNLIMPHPSKVLDLIRSLNFRHLTADEVDGGFDFAKSKLKTATNPNATILISTLAFCENVINLVFLERNDFVQLLPIRVADERWIIVNCLKNSVQYCEDESIVLKSQNGQVFSVSHLVIHDLSVLESEIFVLEASNRMSVYATQSFVDRFANLALHGLGFKEIGYLVEPEKHSRVLP
jgi:hypothetical protein